MISFILLTILLT